ncbi:MAG: EthD family reductase [Mycobacteriales bacterium]|nr:EthD family reductase [Frankia sp.]
MVKYVALYRTPDDTTGFDENYFGTHVPIVNRTPGLVRSEIARVVRTVVGDPAYYVMAELYFTDYDAMRAAFKTEPWQESGANLQSWGGMELVTMFTAQVVDDGGANV